MKCATYYKITREQYRRVRIYTQTCIDLHNLIIFHTGRAVFVLTTRNATPAKVLLLSSISIRKLPAFFNVTKLHATCVCVCVRGSLQQFAECTTRRLSGDIMYYIL